MKQQQIIKETAYKYLDSFYKFSLCKFVVLCVWNDLVPGRRPDN